jgi:hypothetical protein
VAVHTAGRASSGPIDLDGYTLRVGSRVDQVKRNVWAGVGEQPRALADAHRDDEQVDLVDEVVFEQPSDHAAESSSRIEPEDLEYEANGTVPECT